MHVIILAAGSGSRLADQNPEGLPKCLLTFGGRSLLERHLELLSRVGLPRVDLVIGYDADRIIDHVGRLATRPDVAFHFNPRFEQGSVLSLLAAAETLEAGEAVVVMDADVLYHPAVVQTLARTEVENCYLLDRDFMHGEEPVKIAVRNGVMVDFRKKLDPALEFDMIGESVGFFRFGPDCAADIAAECRRFDEQGMGDAPHEEALRNVLLAAPERFGFEDVTGLPWIEIDFPEDVVRAEQEVLPRIREDYPDF